MKKCFLPILLCLCMVVGLLPTIALASDVDGETKAYVRISSMDELTTGQYVLVSSKGYAPLVFENGESGKNWITAVEPQIAGNTVTDTAGAVWTITVDGSSATLTDSNGVSIAPKSGNTNGIQSGDYRWAVACADGTFTFSGTGEDTTILASNLGKEYKLRAYKTATVNNNPGSYLSTFTLYKLDVVSGGETGGETGGEAGGETGGETEVKTYTVTFDANGGTVTPTSAETDADGKLSVPALVMSLQAGLQQRQVASR